MSSRLDLLVVFGTLLGFGTSAVSAAARYVPDNGSLDAVVASVPSGGTIIVRAGSHVFSKVATLVGKTDVTISGEAGSVLYAAVPAGSVAALRVMGCQRIRIAGLTLEGAFQASRGIRVDQASSQITMSEVEVRRFGSHGIDIDASNSLLVNCSSHHNLSFPDGARSDAHGIVTVNSHDLVIRGCRSYANSGDSFQGDRGTWSRITLENCDFWDEPLPVLTPHAAFGGRFQSPQIPVGKTVSENAIDTKHDAATVGRLTLRDVRMHGFRQSLNPAFDASALVLKERVLVTAQRCTVRDSKIGWRVRVWSNAMQCQLDMVNCWTEGCDAGFRLEDAAPPKAARIRLAQNTFRTCLHPVDFAPSNSTSTFHGGCSVVNCLFEGPVSLPAGIPPGNGNAVAAGTKGVVLPTWAKTLGKYDLIGSWRSTSSPTCGALEQYP